VAQRIAELSRYETCDPPAAGRRLRCSDDDASKCRGLLCRWCVPGRLRCASSRRPCRSRPACGRCCSSARCCSRSAPQGLLAVTRRGPSCASAHEAQRCSGPHLFPKTGSAFLGLDTSVICRALEGRALGPDSSNDVLKVSDAARDPVDASYHENVALAEEVEDGCKPDSAAGRDLP